MHPASTIAEQERLNAIHSSPAGIPTRIVAIAGERLNPKTPQPPRRSPPACHLGFLFCPGLLLERTEHRGTQGSLGNTGTARQPQCRATGLMGPERRSL